MPPTYPEQNQYVPLAPSVPQPQYVPTPTASTIKYAGFWVRAGAMVIDGIILSLVGFAVSLVFGGVVYARAISIILGWCLIVYMVTKYQASPGKIAAGLHIQRVSGERIGVGRAILRELVGKFLSTIVLGIGYLMVAWTKKKQGLHDMVADTVVVENDPTKKKTVWIVIGVLGAGLIPLAIVGILSAVVLASLNSARMNGNDASVKSYMSTALMHGEIYYGGIGNGSYSGYCGSSDALSDLSSASRSGTADANTTSFVCNDSKDAWAASAPLRSGGYVCVDSTGTSPSASVESPLTLGQTSCGTANTSVIPTLQSSPVPNVR